MSLLRQFGPEVRPYTIWVQLQNGTWTLVRTAEPRERTYTKRKVRCIKYCNGGDIGSGGKSPIYEITTDTKTEIYTPEGRVLNITIGANQLNGLFNGVGFGRDNAITSYFPPITTDINCTDYAPLQFEGGQELEEYIITMKCKGNVIDSLTGDIITTFNAERSIDCPGPIAGYAINQYATPVLGRRDLSIHGYYFSFLAEEGNSIKTVDKPFNLSLKEASGDMTIDGGQYEFEMTGTELISIVRKDGTIEPNTNTTTGPPVCRIIIKDAIGILLDVTVFGNPTINIEDPWGNIQQETNNGGNNGPVIAD